MTKNESIYAELKSLNKEMSNHYSDLYVKWDSEVRMILKRRKQNYTLFINNLDGKVWADLPFRYEPYWDNVIKKGRQNANHD